MKAKIWLLRILCLWLFTITNLEDRIMTTAILVAAVAFALGLYLDLTDKRGDP